MQKKFKRLTIRVVKKRVFKEKSAKISASVNSFVSFFLNKSVSLSANVLNSNVLTFFISNESIQSYNSSYSFFSSASEIVSKQSVFVQFQNSSSFVIQSVQNSQISSTEKSTSKSVYNQSAT